MEFRWWNSNPRHQERILKIRILKILQKQTHNSVWLKILPCNGMRTIIAKTLVWPAAKHRFIVSVHPLPRHWVPIRSNKELALEIKDLEIKIDELIQLCDQLERKQAVMETDRETWLSERTRLMEKNEMAKSKVEAMIRRLKTLEQN